MTDAELRDAAVQALKQTTISYSEWVRRRDQGAYPDVTKTKWWQALDLLGRISTPQQPSWTLQHPREPITVIPNPPTIGLNVNNQTNQAYKDIVINGSGDSSVLLQGTTTGCSFDRFQLLKVANRSAVTQAKHAVYCKARGNVFADIYAEQGGHAASSISVRMGNNRFVNTVLRGFNYVSYYEHDGQSGLVEFANGDWQFASDTAVWGDASNDPPTPGIKQEFVFENIAASGPGDFFLKFFPGSYIGPGVTVRGCTLNGKPVTAAMVSDVRNLVIE